MNRLMTIDEICDDLSDAPRWSKTSENSISYAIKCISLVEAIQDEYHRSDCRQDWMNWKLILHNSRFDCKTDEPTYSEMAEESAKHDAEMLSTIEVPEVSDHVLDHLPISTK